MEAKAAREEREAERGRVRKALRRFSSHPNCSMVRKPRNSMNDDKVIIDFGHFLLCNAFNSKLSH